MRADAHAGDLLAALDALVFFDVDVVEVAVGGKDVVVADDDHAANAGEAGADVGDFAVVRGVDGLAAAAADFHALAAGGVGRVFADDAATGRPHPAGLASAADLRDVHRAGLDAARWGGAQALADEDAVGVADAVPVGEFLHVKAVAPGDAKEGVAGADDVVGTGTQRTALTVQFGGGRAVTVMCAAGAEEQGKQGKGGEAFHRASSSQMPRSCS